MRPRKELEPCNRVGTDDSRSARPATWRSLAGVGENRDRSTTIRKVIVSEFVTLDGVMEAPKTWQFPFWNDEAARYKHDELLASDALLLGRVTCQALAAAWPSITDEEGFANRMNGPPSLSPRRRWRSWRGPTRGCSRGRSLRRCSS